MDHHQVSYCPETPASEVPGWLGAVRKVFRQTGRSRRLVVVPLAVMTLGLLIPSYGQNVVNCTSFSSTGACGVGSGQVFNPIGGATPPSVSGSRILFIAAGTTHQGTALNYTSTVNVQAFTANFTFVPNGQNVAFVLQNTNDTPGYQGADFVAGAGCEAGFFQAYGSFPPPNNIFALELDSWSYLGSVQSFTYSSAQIYQAGQSPCNPNDGGSNYTLIDKISTSPVPLNSPANAQGTTTGDTYSATLTYDGTNLTLNMYDVTAGGACPGANCFTYTWNVNIPSWVGANTAYVGITGAPGETSIAPLYIDSFSYTVGSPTQAATPTFSPVAGTYTGSQSVSISDATSGATVYYTTNGTTPTTSSTQYTGPITVSSTETLKAIAVATGDTNSAVASAAYTITSLPTVSTPTFSPAAGSYSTAQSVTISDGTSGATIYYTTDGTTPTPSSTQYTGPIAVSSTETLKAIAAAPGAANSSVASAAYTINLSLPTVSMPAFSPAAGPIAPHSR